MLLTWNLQFLCPIAQIFLRSSAGFIHRVSPRLESQPPSEAWTEQTESRGQPHVFLPSWPTRRPDETPACQRAPPSNIKAPAAWLHGSDNEPGRLFALADIRHSQTPDATSWFIAANARKTKKKHENKTLPLFPGCGCQDDAADESISISLFFPPFLSLSLCFSQFLCLLCLPFSGCFSFSAILSHRHTQVGSSLHYLVKKQQKENKNVNIRERKWKLYWFFLRPIEYNCEQLLSPIRG